MAVSSNSALGKSDPTVLVNLSFQIGGNATGPLPVALSSFNQFDEYGYTPRQDDPLAPNKANGTVTVPTGSLRVRITPAEAVTAGAQWRIGQGDWYAGQDITVADLLPGTYTVTFAEVTGWIKPQDQTVQVHADQTAEITGLYLSTTGSLRVTIEPPGAILAGGLWRVDGGSWHLSGETVAGLTPGEHVVSFRDTIVPGCFGSDEPWHTPQPFTVIVEEGATTTATGYYWQGDNPHPAKNASADAGLVAGMLAALWFAGRRMKK